MGHKQLKFRFNNISLILEKVSNNPHLDRKRRVRSRLTLRIFSNNFKRLDLQILRNTLSILVAERKMGKEAKPKGRKTFTLLMKRMVERISLSQIPVLPSSP